jgi:hypothetical protein
MTAIRHYEEPTAGDKFLGSPFKPGDRVNTLKGTGTIYQSGAYDSWVVLDTTWDVRHVRTEFVTHLRNQANEKQRIEGVEPGYPTLGQLEGAGYEVTVVTNPALDLGDALRVREAIRNRIGPDGRNDWAEYRVISLWTKHDEHYNEHAVVKATRDEPKPYDPIGLG